MILIVMQSFYFFYLLVMIFQRYYQKIDENSLFISYPIDISVQMVIEGSIIGFTYYILTLICFIWNNIFVLVAFSAICRNLTQNELLNR